MKVASFFFFIFLLFSAAIPVEAQQKAKKHLLQTEKGKTQFYLGGNYRIRGEIQNHYNVKTYGITGKEDFLLSRLRLDMGFSYTDNIGVRLQLQDARVFGSSFDESDFNGRNNPFYDPLDINNAYLFIKPLDSLRLSIGRQALNIGDRRIFGPGDWGNSGRYIWDAINIQFNGKGYSIQAVYGANILHQPDVFPNWSKEAGNAFALYSRLKMLPVDIDIFYVNKIDFKKSYQSEKGALGNLAIHHAGIQTGKQLNNVTATVLFVHSFGSYSDDRISSSGITANFSWQPNITLKPHVMLGYIYGSGDKDPFDGRRQTFDGIFSGSDTDLYSWMNFAFWNNIHQVRADLVVAPHKNVELRAEYHLFFLDSATDAWYFPGKAIRRDISGKSGSFVGQEMDFTAKVTVAKWLLFQGGFCYFIPGEFVANTGTHPDASWLFSQLTILF